MIRIDGSMGEGGGQILRSALSLSLLTGTPFLLENIRARRAKPGLRPQHLMAVKAAAAVGQARVEGDEVGSFRLEFAPRAVQGGDYVFDIGTAGSTSLVLQTVYLPLAFAPRPSTVAIGGGTHVPWSPCFHYLEQQWGYFLGLLGLNVDLRMVRAGFYPPGGGLIRARIDPVTRCRPLHLTERGALRRVSGLSAVANLDLSIAHRQRAQALQRLAHLPVSVDIEVQRLPAFAKGTVLLLLAEFEQGRACFFSLGELGKPAETVADEAVDELTAFLDGDGVMDVHLADQLLLPLAFADGDSRFRSPCISNHLLTNAEVIRHFLSTEILIEGELGKAGDVLVCPPAGG